MSKNSIEVYKVGSKVKLTDDVYGYIVGISIRGDNHITYECSWWNGRSHDSKWFYSGEIEITVGEKTKIGFIWILALIIHQESKIIILNLL